MSDSEVALWGIDGSIVLYGIMADILLIVPLVIYCVLNDTNSWAQYHQTYINMLYSAYAPLGISWWIVLADDSRAARTTVKGAIEMAGLGPFALLWVGWATFAMSAKTAGVLTTTNLFLYIMAILYPFINIILIVAHYHLSPPMYAWLEEAPMLQNPIDSVRPWAAPEGYDVSDRPAAQIAKKTAADEAGDIVDQASDEGEAEDEDVEASEGGDGWL